MNDFVKHIEPKALHFNKWSNRSYAIFNSIGRVVHIGFLSTIIQKLITVKTLISNGLFSIFHDAFEQDAIVEESINQLEIAGISDLFPFFNATPTSISSDRCEQEDINTICNKRINRAHIGSFLFYGNYTSSTEEYSSFYSIMQT